MIWPLGLIIQAMTSPDGAEIGYCLQTLQPAPVGTRFMHESFDKDNPAKYTRSRFVWANTILGELMPKIQRERPNLPG